MVVAYLGHQSGKSKKGQAFTILYYTFSNARVHGQAADKQWIYEDSGIKLPEGLEPGEALDLDFDNGGYLVGLDRA